MAFKKVVLFMENQHFSRLQNQEQEDNSVPAGLAHEGAADKHRSVFKLPGSAGFLRGANTTTEKEGNAVKFVCS